MFNNETYTYYCNIHNFIKEGTNTPGFDDLLKLEGTYVADGITSTVTIASAAIVKGLMLDLYMSRRFPVVFPTDTQVTEQIIIDNCINRYRIWKQSKLDNYIRAFYALQLDYAPLDNYSGIETKTIDHGHIESVEYGKTDSTTYGRTETTETNIFGYNSGAAGAPSDKVTSTLSNGDSNETSGTDTTTHSGTDTEMIEKHGNLGVTSSQQMINAEWELRKRNFVLEVIKDFIDTYTIY